MNDLTRLCEAITKLALTGGEFTADHVREMLPGIQTKFLGQAFRQLHNNQTICLVRYENSKTEGRNSSLIRVWKGDYLHRTKHYG